MSDDTTVPGAPATLVAEEAPIAFATVIPLLNNRFFMWDFLKVIVISVLGLWVAVFAVSLALNPSDPVLLPWQFPALCGGIVAVCFVIACLVMGNGYGATFVIDDEGVRWGSGPKEKRVNMAVTVVGVLAGSAQVAGAGLLAQSEQSGLIRWANVRRLNVHPGPRVISVRNRWRVVVRLHVPVELWDAVLVRLRRGVARV